MSWPRSQARRAAVQALYQWQVTGSNLSEIERQFVEEHGLDKADPELFHELLHEIPARLNEIDAALGVYLDRPIGDVDLVERAVLRIGAYELLYRLEVPFRVILNEAIRYAKEFGSVQGYRFVNGILDRVARQARAHEIAAGHSTPVDGAAP
ncbi:MAG: transcription antitermination factor NusB [Methylotetracoccus sp.]